MKDINGNDLGLSVRQLRFAALVKEGKRFDIKGHSLICKSTKETFPVAMADSIHIWPKDCIRPEYLNR